jgi:hypothetical protein
MNIRSAYVSLALVFSMAIPLTIADEGAKVAPQGAAQHSEKAANKTETTIRLRVRVEDQLGRPLPNAKGSVFKMTPPANTAAAMRAARLDLPIAVIQDRTVFNGNADGIVETSPLPSKSAYVLEVSADGFAPELTRWTHPKQSGTVELPIAKLRRLGRIRGIVLDRKGQPIPKVTVIQSGDGPKRFETVSSSSSTTCRKAKSWSVLTPEATAFTAA